MSYFFLITSPKLALEVSELPATALAVRESTHDTIKSMVNILESLTSEVALTGNFISTHDERVIRLISLIYVLNKKYSGKPFFTDEQLTKLLGALPLPSE